VKIKPLFGNLLILRAESLSLGDDLRKCVVCAGDGSVNQAEYLHGILGGNCRTESRTTKSVLYVPLQVNRFEDNILLIVQYRYSKSFSGDFNFPELIHRTRSCVTGSITPSGWVFQLETESVTLKWYFGGADR